MHLEKVFNTFFLIGAVFATALPNTEQDQSGLIDAVEDAADPIYLDKDNLNSTETITTREDKAFASVTTWSGVNCRGSSANHGVGTVKFTCFHTPGGSFSEFHAFGGCVMTTWSGTNCRGSSKRFHPSNEDKCTRIPFGSYSLNC